MNVDRCISGVSVVAISIFAMTGCAARSSNGTPPPRVTLAPMCSILAEVSSSAEFAWNGQVFVSDRNDDSPRGQGAYNFGAFRPMAGPLGNPRVLTVSTVTKIPDTYGVDEAWFRWLADPDARSFPMIYRSQSTPANRPTGAGGIGDSFGGSWIIAEQDSDGAWRNTDVGHGSATQINDPVTPEMGMATVPHFMWVGLANPHLFACAGGRTTGLNRVTGEPTGQPTTWLIEVIPAVTAFTPPTAIQDVLYGASGKPGDPTGYGAVDCAMSQISDDVTSRQLHLFALKDGKLQYAKLSNFGSTTTSSGFTDNRFRTVSDWIDVGSLMGPGHENITSFAAVGLPAGLRLFFVAKVPNTNNAVSLYETRNVNGTWTLATDVFWAAGNTPGGGGVSLPDPSDTLKVSAALCPAFGAMGASTWSELSAQTVVAIANNLRFQPAYVILALDKPQDWGIGQPPSIYSPWLRIAVGSMTQATGTSGFSVRGLRVVRRPFADNALPK
jgi:hypothetical protein